MRYRDFHMRSVRPIFSLIASRRCRVAVLVISLVGFLPIVPRPGDGNAFAAAFPDQLAFVSSRTGSIQIYTVGADGAGLYRLTNEPGQSEIPVWSPDGKQLVFVKIRGSDTQVFVMNADGSKQRQLTFPPGISTFPAWSPDGKRIAFVSTREGSRQIYVMRADGREQTRLTAPPVESTVPTWSPDGRQLAFVTTRDKGVNELYVMNADGTKQRPLTEAESYVANEKSQGEQHQELVGILLKPGILHPTWSPNGKLIAFVIRVGLAEQSIEVVSPDDGSRKRLVTGYAPAWSPDGRQVAYVVSRLGDARIYVRKTDTGDVTRLTSRGVNLLPTWSPDGRRIAFLAILDRGLGVYVMNADGTGQRWLADAAGDLSVLPIFSWRPRQRR